MDYVGLDWALCEVISGIGVKSVHDWLGGVHGGSHKIYFLNTCEIVKEISLLNASLFSDGISVAISSKLKKYFVGPTMNPT